VLIFVDSSDAGAPPYAGDLDPGMHTFEAKGDKAVAPPKQIQVEKKGSYSEILELHEKAGTIIVNVDVADTEISIDGKVVAHGVYEGPADAGTHALTVTKDGYAPYKKDLIVDDGQRAIENVALQKLAVAAAPAARLHLRPPTTAASTLSSTCSRSSRPRGRRTTSRRDMAIRRTPRSPRQASPAAT
jgi:hypothetical protein